MLTRQHTLTCELRLSGIYPVRPHPAWQHTLTCELRHKPEELDILERWLATYAYVRVATKRSGYRNRWTRWQHTLTCELRRFFHWLFARKIQLATYSYVRVATIYGSMPSQYQVWQHTLTCELRHLFSHSWPFPEAGNIRLRASCDRVVEILAEHAAAGNIRLRASCDTLPPLPGPVYHQLATYAYVRVATP